MTPLRLLARPASSSVRSIGFTTRAAYSSFVKEVINTTNKARESAGESNKSTPLSTEKTAGKDAQSEQSQRAMKDRENAEAQPNRGGNKKDTRSEFPESPGIIGMEDQVGSLHNGKPSNSEGKKGTQPAPSGNHSTGV